MAREKMGKVATTVGLPPEMIEELKAKAKQTGTPWTSLIPQMVRKGLDADKPRQAMPSDP